MGGQRPRILPFTYYPSGGWVTGTSDSVPRPASDVPTVSGWDRQ